MLRVLTGLLSAIFLASPAQITVQAKPDAYHWYCAHTKGHKQPEIAKELAFVENLEGYFIDRNHTDPTASEKVIYLTFDAGYENGNVEKTLNVLREENVPAAFFILGNLISKNTDLVKRMAEEGHAVCNHTVHHKNMSGAIEAEFLEELHALEQLYKEETGYVMAPYYRPPEGTFSKENLESAAKNGYKTIFWSFAYPDWDNKKQMDPQKAKTIILDNIHNGEVMLLHPTSATNAAVLSEVIKTLKNEGYRFGTLDELTGGGACNASG